jgi:signal transduction histidine kinase
MRVAPTNGAVAGGLSESVDGLPTLSLTGQTYQVSEPYGPGSSCQEQDRLRQLTAGLAHDYNNLLAVMLCGAGLALNNLEPDHPARPALEIASNAVERAAELTRQLMAYAGLSPPVLSKVNLSVLVRNLVASTRPSLPGGVQIVLNLAADLPLLLADASQIEQLLHALITNAVEAIGDDAEGLVSICACEIENIETSGGGTAVQVEVSDTGCGMDERTRRRIFDPFFSTKFLGRGLGLAAAAGIIRLHSGTIEVHSTPGVGSTFRLCLPALPPDKLGDHRSKCQRS